MKQKKLMPVEEAKTRMLSAVPAAKDIMSIPLDLALGCYLAKPIVAPIDVPPADNSAMDGYALRLEDWQSPQQVFPVSQRIAAGKLGAELESGSVARIFTGAHIPPGANSVVPQEDCELVKEQDMVIGVKVKQQPSSGGNIRPQGQDIKTGSVLLPAGQKISPQAAGLIASIGLDNIEIYRPLKVAIFSTGDELIEPGESALPGQIYNSNRYTLAAMIEGMGMEFIDLGIIPDNYEATRQALTQAADEADIVISSGGVSVGEEDHIKRALESVGKLALWKLAIKPGKPLSFGEVKNKPFVGLPGNPSAVYASFCILVWSVLLKMQGAKNFVYTSYSFPAEFEWRGGKRQEYLRARLSGHGADSSVQIYTNQSSGVLSSAVWANGFAVVPIEKDIYPGAPVEFIPFDQFFCV